MTAMNKRHCKVCGNPAPPGRATCSSECYAMLHTIQAKRYEPTKDEIAAACAEIQAGWSETEKQQHIANDNDKPCPAVIPGAARWFPQ